MAEGQVEGVCWRYGQGLRIAGAPHYARGTRVLPLPGTRHWERTTSWEARLANTLRQMVALCGGKLNHCPGARTLRSRSLLEWATDCLPDHQVWLQEAFEPQVLLDQARDAIQAGGSALLYCRPERQSPRWMLLAGVQQVWQSAGWGAVQALLALTQEAEVKDRLKAVTQQAIDRGVFGAPTFFVGDQMFWGQDRLDFVERKLSGA